MKWKTHKYSDESLQSIVDDIQKKLRKNWKKPNVNWSCWAFKGNNSCREIKLNEFYDIEKINKKLSIKKTIHIKKVNYTIFLNEAWNLWFIKRI